MQFYKGTCLKLGINPRSWRLRARQSRTEKRRSCRGVRARDWPLVPPLAFTREFVRTGAAAFFFSSFFSHVGIFAKTKLIVIGIYHVSVTGRLRLPFSSNKRRRMPTRRTLDNRDLVSNESRARVADSVGVASSCLYVVYKLYVCYEWTCGVVRYVTYPQRSVKV